MSTSGPYTDLAVVKTSNEFEISLVRGADGGVYLRTQLRDVVRPEEAAAFKGAARRAKASSVDGFEEVVEATASSYVSAIYPGERLDRLHAAVREGGLDAVPVHVVSQIVLELIDALAALHEQGQCSGPFDVSNVHLGADGLVRLADGPIRALKVQSGGVAPTMASDMKSLGRLVQTLSPSATISGITAGTSAGGASARPTRVSNGHGDLLGQTIGDRYVIQDVLGQGGMGTVYVAQQESIQRTVAIKVLHREYADSPDIVRRFHQEALAASRLSHPNTISIYDFGQMDQLLYIAMEHLKGQTLDSAISASGGFGVERALTILKQVLKSVGEAHKQDIVHRDLKPENIFLMNVGDERDFVKVLDFGVAKLGKVGDDQATITMAGSVFGTPRYMAPEQSQDVDLDRRADLYSLGVVFYEMLTGHVPFGSENPLSVLMAHATQPPPRFSRLKPDLKIPEAVEAVVFKALAKDPSRRYQTASEMAEDVDRLILLVDGRADADVTRSLPRLEQVLPAAGVKSVADTLSGMQGWSALNALGEQLTSGALEDAVDLRPLVEEKVRPIGTRPSTAEWLEETFVGRAEQWRDSLAEDDTTAQKEALVGLLADPLSISPPGSEEASSEESGAEETAPPGAAPPAVSATARPSVPAPPERYLAVIEDGYEPELWAPRPPAKPARLDYGLDDFLTPMTHTEASGDSSSSIVLEVLRCVGDGVMESGIVHVDGKYRLDGDVVAKVGERFVDISLPKGAEGEIHRLGKTAALTGDARLEPGERASFEHQGQTFRLRVDHAPRQVGQATGLKRPWKLWGACAGIGLAIHLGFFLFVTSLSSMGVQLTVEAPPAKEIFKDVLLKKEPPKPKVKPKKPKPKKPKPKIKKKPKPPDPSEAKPVIPETVKKRIKAQIDKRTKGARTVADKLDKLFEQPADNSLTLAGARRNVHAAKAGGSGPKLGGLFAAGGPGDRINVKGGNGSVVTKGGVGKGVGRLAGRARGKKIRGRVKTVRALARVRGTLSRGEVLKAINKRIGKIQRCYERALQKGGKKLSGKINAEWTIGTNGRVKRARSKLDTLGNPKVTSCVLKQIKKMKFPRPKGGEVVVVFPFMFSSR